MRSRKGFTLIELMIVVVIVGVLAAIVGPLLLSRIERAKYSEGKAIAGQIATALRAYVAEYGATGTYDLVTNLGFKADELSGKHFTQSAATMVISGVSLSAAGALSYTITLTPDAGEGLNAGTLILTCTGGAGGDSVFTTSSGQSI
ncbi:MAG: prepilin-type N-terminal cleavage/methylation domain-containing protein [Thermoplasmata archaeon]|nr:MAG: prepilin-type N-terminal cleavage/methylation domain-containing protein [Thermoplasmata archaeon]